MLHNIELKFQYFLSREINELYVTHALRSFAMSTISVFLPIFFLQNNYSLPEVLLYYVISVSTGTTFFYVGTKFAANRGAKHSIGLSIPLVILFFLSLYNLDYLVLYIGRLQSLILLGVLWSVSSAFYFSGFHIDFAKFSEKSTKEISIMQALGTMFSIFGPLFGALIISFYSFQILFLLIVVVLVLSVVPLFFSGELHEPFEFRIRGSFSMEQIKRNWVFFAEGMRDYSARIFWPILLFLLAIDLKTIGGLFTLSNGILALFTIYIGRKIHDGNKDFIMRIGSIVHTFSLAFRTILKTIASIAVVQGIGAISITMVNLPFHSAFYNRSKQRGIASTIFFRELYLHAGRAFNILIVAVGLLIFSPINAVIISIIIGSVFTLFMARIKE